MNGGPDADLTEQLVARLEAASRARLGRSLAVLHVGAGGCGGCELELHAALVQGLSQFGLCFVAHPGEADVLLVTGPVARAMAEPLARTHAAMAEPKWVVAMGECAIDGGVFRDSYAVLGGVAPAVPVDLVLRGCPPTPVEVIQALRSLVEANA